MICVWEVQHLSRITFQCTLHLDTTLHLCYCLSVSLSLSPACCLSIDITHPKRNNTVSSRALTMMHEPDGKHFSGVVIIKPFFSTGPMWKKYKDRAQSVILQYLWSFSLASVEPWLLDCLLFNYLIFSTWWEMKNVQRSWSSGAKKPSLHSLFHSLPLQSSLTHVLHALLSASVSAGEWAQPAQN